MSAVPTQRRRPPRIADEDAARFLLTVEDDTEDAPWMVMGDLQFWSASSFAVSARASIVPTDPPATPRVAASSL